LKVENFFKQYVSYVYQPAVQFLDYRIFKHSHTFNEYFFFLFLVAIVGVSIWTIFTKGKISLLPRRLFALSWVLFLCVTLLQCVGMTFVFSKGIQRFAGKSLDERERLFFGDILDFSQSSLALLPAGCGATLVTDLDLSRDLGMTVQRALGFMLYPIDIRGVKGSPEECLVLFGKENALEFIPSDYQVLLEYSSRDILAIKKTKNKI